MAFDRGAINIGRYAPDFGLCDLRGVYQHTSRLRGKGFLAIAFVNPLAHSSLSVVRTLQDWLKASDKIALVAVMTGERADAEEFAQTCEATFPVLWDFEDNTTRSWSVSATPTVFVVDGAGLVIGKVTGSDKSELDAAGAALAEATRRAEEAARIAAEAAAKK
jgi:peroxiredoxin